MAVDSSVLTLLHNHQKKRASVHERNGCASLVNTCGPLCVDFTQHGLDEGLIEVFEQMVALCDASGAFKRLLEGDIVNQSEQRSALHTLLRSKQATCPSHLLGAWRDHENTQSRMRQWVSVLEEQHYLGASGRPIKHIVHLGMGGSHLGPKITYKALAEHGHSQIDVTFVSSVDESALQGALQSLDPHTTVFLIVSKSFTTQETLCNAQRAQQWLTAALGNDITAHLWAVTAHADRAQLFGVAAAHILLMPLSVGGRFSVWSAANVTLLLALGSLGFDQFLAGASAMDEHAQTLLLSENIPLMSACLDVWYSVGLSCAARALVPYGDRLSGLSEYVQQLWMESLGKSVDQTHQPLMHPSGSVLLGGTGTESQHAFHQLLWQGTHLIPIDFILPLGQAKDHYHQSWLWAHGLSQYSVLGGCAKETSKAPYAQKSMDQPCTLWLLSALTPYALGMLLACFEHRVFYQSVLLGINAFDQWGVEEGKALAPNLHQALQERNRTDLEWLLPSKTIDFILKSI